MCLVCVLCVPFRHMLPGHGLMGLFNHGDPIVIVQRGEGCNWWFSGWVLG